VSNRRTLSSTGAGQNRYGRLPGMTHWTLMNRARADGHQSLCDVRVSTFDVWVLTIGVVAAIT